jgi:hypothetical protein
MLHACVQRFDVIGGRGNILGSERALKCKSWSEIKLVQQIILLLLNISEKSVADPTRLVFDTHLFVFVTKTIQVRIFSTIHTHDRPLAINADAASEV